MDPAATSDPAAEQRSESRIALFSASIAVLLLGGLLAARIGLPTDFRSVALAFAIGLWPILGPAALHRRLVANLGGALSGVLTVVLLLAPFAIVLLGFAGEVLIYAGAIWLAWAVARRASGGSGWCAAGALAFALIGGALFILQIGGTKYVNFVADQLALFGRTDGDVLGHGAIINSLRYFGVPSMGIDGIRPLHYHVGVNVLAAALAIARGQDAIFAIVLVKVLVLTPLLARVAASAAVTSSLALGAQRIGVLRILWLVLGIVVLLPLTDIGNMRLASESMLLGGILLLCAAPSLLAHWMRAEPASTGRWLFWLALIPLIAISKVSAGAIWFGLVGYTALRSYGLGRVQTWAVGGAALALFGAAFWLANDPAGMGAQWFGEPYYLERAVSTGDYLLPVRIQIEWFGTLLCLWAATRLGHVAQARRLLEPLLVVATGANLPGLLMQIPGGDAYYFITISNWIALPVLIATAAMLLDGAGATAARRKWVGRVVATTLAIGGVVLTVPEVKLGARHFIAGNALLRTGDLDYYDSDNKRPVREDAERAWQKVDHRTLLTGPRAAAPAEGLLALLGDRRREKDRAFALYVGPQVMDYWSYVRDCDLSSAFAMAVAGVQMIDGYYPDQSVCTQEISRRGYSDVPERRALKSDAELCDLAQQRGVMEVEVIESLTDRARDRLVACGPG